MAEGALITIVKSVLQQLSSPALTEFLLLYNFKKELKKLEGTVQTISDVLQDAERKQSADLLVQRWLARLKEVMYDADDLFDMVAARALREKAMNGNAFKKEVRLFFSKSNQLGFIVKTAHKVKEIRERLDDIARDRNQFNFEKLHIEEKPFRLLDREETHSFVQLKDVIGREEDKEEIIKLLVPEDHRGEKTDLGLSVIAIIGFGGLGKTTLAKLVYNDDKVQKDFDLCLWVCINYFDDLNEVLVAIITSAIKSKPNDLNLDQLQEKLRGSIRDKKYLLVLDDVWDENPQNWDKLKSLLDCGKSGSKVLVTTRKRTVARCLNAIKPHYDLKALSKESAWRLFVEKTFEDGELDSDPALELLGRQVIDKCKYVPLALVTIGGLVRSKEREKKEWLSFIKNELPEALSNDYDDDKSIMHALKVSYNDLRPALKFCFAYCSVFPKDYKFDKDELVRLWLAQGFLEPFGSEQSLEKVGDAYFHDLVDRCFFQDVKRSTSYGCFKYTCKMHDLVHDLAIEVGGRDNKCFVNDDEIGRSSTYRHICVNFRVDSSYNYSDLLSHSKTSRTLLFLSREHRLDTDSFNTLLRRFRMLRTLELTGSKIDKIPDSIGELIHLRYLNLSGNRCLEFLPNSICNIFHLQILILEDCARLKELPLDIRKLVSLRHLLLKYCHMLASLPSGLANLTSLVILDRFIVHPDHGGLRYLGNLDNLCGTLKVVLPRVGWLNAVEDARKSNVSAKHKLTGLNIEWQRDSPSGGIEQKLEKDDYKGVLEVLQPHENLEYLRISKYGGNILSSWVFSLPNVKRLILDNSTLGYLTDKVRCDLFLPSLEIIELNGMRNLKGWWKQVEDGDDHPVLKLPRVTEVVIRECPKLTGSMPLFGRTEKLILRGVNEKLVRELLIGSTSCLSSSSSSSSDYNSKLKELSLENIEGLTCLPESWISHLTALEELKFENYQNVIIDSEMLENDVGMSWKALRRLRVLELPIADKHFQKGLQYFIALEELDINHWVVNDEDREGGGMSWEGLQRLHQLRIGFGGNVFHFPKDVQHLRSLQDLTISNCKELSLSWTAIANLKLDSLWFDNVDKVVNLDKMAEEQQCPVSSLEVLRINLSETAETEWILGIPWKLFLSLRTLEIRGRSDLITTLPKDKGMPWKALGSLRALELPTGDKHIRKVLQYLTALEELTINKCIVDDEEREVDGMLWKGFERLVRLDIGFGGKAFHFPKDIQHFRSLQSLRMRDCRELSLSWTTIASLKLNYLRLLDVDKVINVDEMAEEQHCPVSSLKDLTILFSKTEETEWIHSIPWKFFPSLYELEIMGDSDLSSVPGGIQYLTSLRFLSIRRLGLTTKMPSWIVNLSSLQFLCFYDCSSELLERCKQGTGKDWHLISHIPYIAIRCDPLPNVNNDDNDASVVARC